MHLTSHLIPALVCLAPGEHYPSLGAFFLFHLSKHSQDLGLGH